MSRLWHYLGLIKDGVVIFVSTILGLFLIIGILWTVLANIINGDIFRGSGGNPQETYLEGYE